MLRRILRPVLVLAAVSVMGCSESGSFAPFASHQSEAPQLAAYAANATYPADMHATDDWRAGALIDAHHRTIKVINFSDRSLSNVNVWVDGNFVSQVTDIPPHGMVSLDESKFYDRVGHQMSQAQFTPTRVEVQTSDHLYTLEGPVME